jgi:membrane-associated protease RseP (regulator of RpoE activity)
MGAFVDVNEKQLEKANEKINAKVSVAGSAANLATCAIFFIPTLILLSAIPNYYADKLVVIGISEKLAMKGLENGMQILAVNGAEVYNITQFAQLTKNISANQTITILTNKGEFLVTTDSAGKIGIIVTQPIKDEYWYIKSLFSICGLITVLNFLVGVINLIPLPAFDGHRLFKIAIKNDAIVNAIVWLVIIAFLLNLLPWLWH